MPDINKETLMNFIKFGVVGGIGFIINVGFFFLMVDVYKLLGEYSAIVIGFLLAVTSNYILNHNWTFRKEGQKAFDSVYYVKFMVVSLIGLAINFVGYELVIYFIPLPENGKVIAQMCGIASAMFFNFFLSAIFVFGDGVKEEGDKDVPAFKE